MDRNPKSHTLLCQSWQVHFWSTFLSKETWCANTTKDSKTFQKTFEWEKPALTLCFEKIWRKNSPGQSWQSMTGMMDSDVLVRVEKKRLLEMMKIQAERMESRGYKNWPSEEVKITNYMERVGIEMRINSVQKDGSQSWTVISRSIDQYVTELSEENEKPTTKKWFPMRRNPLRQNSRNNSYHHQLHFRRLLCRSINGNGKTLQPVETLMENPSGSRLQRRSGKKWFLSCLDSKNFHLYMRALQGHSGRNKVDPSLQDNEPSSRRCTTTLTGDEKAMKKIVNRIP